MSAHVPDRSGSRRALSLEAPVNCRCIDKGALDKPILLPHKFHDELERVCEETQNHSLRKSEFGILMKSLQEVRGCKTWVRGEWIPNSPSKVA